ncbi:unnamed protein product [Adineta steineri]|uniref:Uncharacterized protein n=1 Tax=Adineta steineri TaxID=433720 RepID=A0A814CBC4_9BILA|nr:unnamed protein product [Adineta steineri]CAF1060391.1 unnamed protein product [Adineta steineri]CAF1109747.1 unnamed protein product [Adineta steineri]
MIFPERSTQTDRSSRVTRHFNSLKTADVLKFLSSLLLPLALGIFTVVITFQQQQAAKQQRDEDRMASDKQRDQERNLSDEKYKNERLDTYVKEMGLLLEKNKGSLVSKDFLATLARVKTLNIFRQLDSQRNTRIIQFLHEAKQLHETEERRSLDLSAAKLRDIDFRSTDFRFTKASYTDFRQITAVLIEFSSATLTHSIFMGANIKYTKFNVANLNNVTFSRANLYKVDFSGSNVADEQLQSAFSIHDSILSNKTHSRDMNLITNGNANCNTSLVDPWVLQTGNINTVLFNKTDTDCRFALQSLTTGVTMLQRVDLSNKWDFRSWPHSEAVLTASMSTGVCIQLKGNRRIKYVCAPGKPNSSEANINLTLNDDMRELEVLIKFNALVNSMPMRASGVDIHSNARWNEHGQIVAGQNFTLVYPYSVFVAEDQTIYVGDYENHTIVAWYDGETQAQIVAGGHGSGDGAHQLNQPLDVIVDKERDSLLICDRGNKRVVRWPRRNGIHGEIVLSNIGCWGLTMDDAGSLYVADYEKNEVIRYRRDNVQGTVVAGGNGNGNRLSQLDSPSYLFVNREHSVFISDTNNRRVMKWVPGAKEGMIVVAGRGQGGVLSQILNPAGVLVDQSGTVYVADFENHHILRCSQRTQQGMLVACRDDQVVQGNQLNGPMGLSFDRHGHLYVVDNKNKRVQKFTLEMSSK